jgi:hypothetical protein
VTDECSGLAYFARTLKTAYRSFDRMARGSTRKSDPRFTASYSRFSSGAAIVSGREVNLDLVVPTLSIRIRCSVSASGLHGAAEFEADHGQAEVVAVILV